MVVLSGTVWVAYANVVYLRFAQVYLAGFVVGIVCKVNYPKLCDFVVSIVKVKSGGVGAMLVSDCIA